MLSTIPNILSLDWNRLACSHHTPHSLSLQRRSSTFAFFRPCYLFALLIRTQLERFTPGTAQHSMVTRLRLRLLSCLLAADSQNKRKTRINEADFFSLVSSCLSSHSTSDHHSTITLNYHSQLYHLYRLSFNFCSHIKDGREA